MGKKLIILDNGHGENTTGKRSPDGTLREYAYAREIVKRLKTTLEKIGYKVELLVPENKDIPLLTRVARTKIICHNYKDYDIILLSIHCNAAPPNDNAWHSARGWCAYSSVGKTKSDKLVKCLYEAADVYLKDYVSSFHIAGTPRTQRPIRDTKDESRGWEANFTILKDTPCTAVLTENMFQDNREDVSFLLSEKGKQAIIDLHLAGIVKFFGNLDLVPSIAHSLWTIK